MTTAPSKFASNSFDSATVGRIPLMSAVLDNARGGFSAANNANPAFNAPLVEIDNARASWGYGLSAISNAEAYQLSKTTAVEDKLASLTRKPGIEENSPLESWDLIIRAVAPQGSTLYVLLLPHGRETLTKGTINERIDALQDFNIRLSEQTTKPTLIALSTDEVGSFAAAANTLRDAQIEAIAQTEEKRGEQEALRKASAAALYSAIGQGMSIYKATPERVDELFDVNLLRGNVQNIPGAVLDVAWDVPTRILSTTQMPEDATHLIAFRQGEGGAPEQLAIGETDELTVGIPSSFIFDAGESYDLWIVGKNARGMGPKGPVFVWTVPVLSGIED